MNRRIREHNDVNGVAFAGIEFLIVAAAAAFIAVGFARQADALGTVLAAGIAVNCLVVVGVAIAAYSRGERGSSVMRLKSREYRRQVARDHPTLLADTIAITLAALVPFCLAALVLLEAARARDPKSGAGPA
jgi:hypothetical protein